MAAAIKKLTQREHILQLPDSYIGSRDSHLENKWVWDPESKRMVWRSILFNPGLYKIFDEIVVNALDHVTRQSGSGSGRVSEITFRIKPTEFSVRNDGEGIPVEMHPEYKVMAPELIFGHLLTDKL